VGRLGLTDIEQASCNCRLSDRNTTNDNASQGFRAYSPPQLFAASLEIGLTSVEVDGWPEEELRDKVGVNASPQALDAVQPMAEEAGVKVTARGGAVVAL